jgi:hypothetical protein
MNRVHIENGEMVATDGRILVYAKAPKGVSDGEYGTTKVGETKRDEAYAASWKSVPNFIAKGGYSEVGTIANGDTSADAIHFSAALHKSIIKRVNTPVFRRPGALPAMPFSLIIRIAPGCSTVNTVPPTPALYPAVNPATFVRAGPFNTQQTIKKFS